MLKMSLYITPGSLFNLFSRDVGRCSENLGFSPSLELIGSEQCCLLKLCFVLRGLAVYSLWTKRLCLSVFVQSLLECFKLFFF